jgi:hypothetical protein
MNFSSRDRLGLACLGQDCRLVAWQSGWDVSSTSLILILRSRGSISRSSSSNCQDLSPAKSIAFGQDSLLSRCIISIRSLNLWPRSSNPNTENNLDTASLLQHVAADVHKQVAIPKSLIGTLDSQVTGTVERRPCTQIHDNPSTAGDVHAGGTTISFQTSR